MSHKFGWKLSNSKLTSTKKLPLSSSVLIVSSFIPVARTCSVICSVFCYFLLQSLGCSLSKSPRMQIWVSDSDFSLCPTTSKPSSLTIWLIISWTSLLLSCPVYHCLGLLHWSQRILLAREILSISEFGPIAAEYCVPNPRHYPESSFMLLGLLLL